MRTHHKRTGFSSSNCCPAVRKPSVPALGRATCLAEPAPSPFVLMLGTPAGEGSSHASEQPRSQGPSAPRRELTACARASGTLLGGPCPQLGEPQGSWDASRVWAGGPSFCSLEWALPGPRWPAPAFLPAAWSGQAWAGPGGGGPHILVSVFPAVCPRGHRQGFLGRMCRAPGGLRALEGGFSLATCVTDSQSGKRQGRQGLRRPCAQKQPEAHTRPSLGRLFVSRE